MLFSLGVSLDNRNFFCDLGDLVAYYTVYPYATTGAGRPHYLKWIPEEVRGAAIHSHVCQRDVSSRLLWTPFSPLTARCADPWTRGGWTPGLWARPEGVGVVSLVPGGFETAGEQEALFEAACFHLIFFVAQLDICAATAHRRPWNGHIFIPEHVVEHHHWAGEKDEGAQIN